LAVGALEDVLCELVRVHSAASQAMRPRKPIEINDQTIIIVQPQPFM
jgi:hypothetical protein